MMIGCNEAVPVLSPFFDQLWSCVTSAIEDYQQLDAAERLRHTMRTKSSLINDYMVDHAKTMFSESPIVGFVNMRGRTCMVVDDQFRIAFKKLNRRRRTSNIPTQQALAFVNQLTLPGLLPPMTNLAVGYQWNLLQTDIGGVFIVCPMGARNEWEIEVKAPVAAAVARIPDYLESQEAVARIRPKIIVDQDVAQGEGNAER